MPPETIKQITDVLSGLKKIRTTRTIQCHQAIEKYKSGVISKRELDNLIDMALEDYFDSNEFQEYKQLKHIASKNPEIDSVISQIYNEGWELTIPSTDVPNTFQLSWDTKNSTKFPSEELRLEIVEMILTENIQNIIKQPTESTIIFESDENFDYWQSKFNGMLKKMYFSFCQTNADSLLIVEENDTLDLPAVIVDVKKKIKAIRRLRRIVRDSMSDGMSS